MSAAIQSGHSVLLLGETGTGTDEFAQAIYDRFAGELSCAIATYKGSGKKFFEVVAEQLDIPTEATDDNGKTKALTMDALKEEIAQNVSPQTLLVLPEAKRLTTGIRYWLEDLMSSGVRVVTTAVVNPNRDIFLDMVEVELSLPDDSLIRREMEEEAQRLGLEIAPSRLAELQPLAGKNRLLAKKVIRNERLGLNEMPKHSQYLDISPLILAALAMLGLLKFIGMGTGDRSLYIVGGVAIMVGMSFKYLGRIQGARRKYGQ